MDINTFWCNLKKFEGESFQTVSGLKFTYHFISENSIITNRTDYPLTKSNFEKALSFYPIEKPGDISNIVRGSSYVFSIITDQRMQ